MRISKPLRGAILGTLLLATLAFVVLSSHLSTHAAAAQQVGKHHAASISVNPNTTIELSDGSFATTIYGAGLAPHKYYKLTDSNASCEDSLTFFPNVQTDLNGRFAYPLVSLSPSSPCRTGSYTVKAVGAGSTYQTKFTLASARVMPTNVAVVPKSVVSLSDGSFAVLIAVQGLSPDTTYHVTDDTVGCTTTYNGGGFNFTTDAEGNAGLTLLGGPSFFNASGPCTPATNTEVVSFGGINVAEAVWSLLPAHA